jgi:8-oxo-dGTP pyrophosphatase MutT (NUDIX family)
VDPAALDALLARHRPADDRERGHVARTRELLRTTDRPFDRRQTRPGHITASAFVLDPAGRELLLIHHAKLGLWLQPGGHVDAEDGDIVAAARREVAEETGLHELARAPGFPDLLDVDIHPIPDNPRKGEGPHEHFDVRVLLRAADRRATAGSDALAVRWVPLERVPDAGTDDSVRRAVRKLLARGVA